MTISNTNPGLQTKSNSDVPTNMIIKVLHVEATYIIFKNDKKRNKYDLTFLKILGV